MKRQPRESTHDEHEEDESNRRFWQVFEFCVLLYMCFAGLWSLCYVNGWFLKWLGVD